MSCGVGHRLDSDLTLLWLCWRQAATALIHLLAWEPPYAVGGALKKGQQKTYRLSTGQITGFILWVIPKYLE